MTVLVLSDSHGRSDLIKKVITAQIRQPDAIIYLGDGLADLFDAISEGNIPCFERDRCAIFAVRGNCDLYPFSNAYPDENIICLDSLRFYISHGHRYGVKSGLSAITARATMLDADVILYGHTHLPHEEYLPIGTKLELFGESSELQKPIYLFNPGSLGASGDRKYHFGLIEIQNGSPVFSHGALE